MFQQIMRGIIFDLHDIHPFGSLDGFATYHASVTDRVMAKDFFGHLGSQRLTPVQCSKFKVRTYSLTRPPKPRFKLFNRFASLKRFMSVNQFRVQRDKQFTRLKSASAHSATVSAGKNGEFWSRRSKCHWRVI